MNETKNRFPVRLFCSLMLLGFIPFFYTLVRTNLIANIPSTDGLGIAGHMEWFDLIHETIQALLIVPLFALFNKCMQNPEKLRERIVQSFLIVNVIYLLFSIPVFIYCNALVSKIASTHISEVTSYLKLETIGFIIANTVSFVHILFVVLEKSFCIYAMILLKTIFTIAGDLFLIPQFGINGVAFSDIAVNLACVILCLAVVFHEKLIAFSFRPDREFLKEYLFVGSFGGLQIFLDNIVYSADSNIRFGRNYKKRLQRQMHAGKNKNVPRRHHWNFSRMDLSDSNDKPILKKRNGHRSPKRNPAYINDFNPLLLRLQLHRFI